MMDNLNLSYKELLQLRVRETPDRVCFNYLGRDYTWKDVDDLSLIIARDLFGLGVRKGTNVGICGRNSWNWVLTFFAAQRLGALTALFNFNLKPEEMVVFAKTGRIEVMCFGNSYSDDEGLFEECRDMLSDNDTYVVNKFYSFVDSIDFSELQIPKEDDAGFDEVEVSCQDDAVMIFTSGSTGQPNAALHSAFSMMQGADICNKRTSSTSESSSCLVLPLFHIFGFDADFTGRMLLNAKIHIAKRPKPDLIFDALYNGNVSGLLGVPAIFFSILNSKEFRPEFARVLKFAIIGGASFTEAQMKKVMELLPDTDFYVGYGLSEITPVCASKQKESISNLCQTVGFPGDGVEIKIIDITTKKKLGKNRIGEILVKGPNLMKRYYDYRKESDPIDKEGWFHTGDIGLVREDGYLVIKGRIKEIIIRGGENIIPSEVEYALTMLEEIKDAKVLGVPDAFWGEEVAAGIILKEGYEFDEKRIKRKLKDTLSDYKIPAYFFDYESFPIFPNGKIDTMTLKQQLIDKVREKKKKGGNNMSDLKEILEEAFYINVGAAASLGERLKDKIEEYREKGKEVTQKGKDLNEELKHTVEEFKEKEKNKDEEEKDILSILDGLTDEEKNKLKEALLNGEKED